MKKLILCVCICLLLVSCGKTLSFDEALYSCDFKAVKKAVKEGANVNSVIDRETGATALMIASSGYPTEESSEIVKYLLDKGADYKAVDYEGKTALMYASLYGNTECAEIIINEDNFLFMNFADVDICDMNNYTALAYAIMANNVEICQLLLDKGADINHLVGTDQKGSLLELAIVCESDEVISLLIENGANVDYVDKEGISIADYAVINGNENALRILLRYNADINTSSPDSGFSPLLYSVLYDSFNMMNLLLSSGANIETVDNDGNNALHLLCMTNPLERSNQIEMAEVLLDKGINLDAYNKAQQTPLMLAIDSGNYEIAEFLIQNDANIALKDNIGTPTLVYAINSGNVNLVERLVEYGATVDFEFQRNGISFTPFEVAIAIGNIEIVDLLISQGIDINQVDSKGLPLWEYAIYYNNPTVLQHLINEGADIFHIDENGISPMIIAGMANASDVISLLLSYGAYVDEADFDGYTALHYACLSVNSGYSEAQIGETITMLISVGSDVNVASFEGGITPLMIAARNGNSYITDVLISFGADVDVINAYGESALECAVRSGDVKTCNFLINAGADVNTVNKNGCSPIYFAVADDNINIVNLLIRAGADVNQTYENKNMLTYAIANNNINMVNLLIRSGADPLAADTNGICPIIYAGYNLANNVIPALIKAGADTNEVDSILGFTPLISACMNFVDGDVPRQIATIKVLLENGADINYVSQTGWTPLTAAMSSTVDCDVIQLLVDNGANMDIEVDGMNLLDFAIENNVDSSIIDYLMSCGLTSMQKNIA